MKSITLTVAFITGMVLAMMISQFRHLPIQIPKGYHVVIHSKDWM